MRKHIKRMVAVLVSALMLLTGILCVSAKTYTDVKSTDWYYDFVNYMSDKAIINGYQDNTFRANNKVKRAEFIKMMVETFGLEAKASIGYTDVKSGDWYYEYYQKAAAQGFLEDVFTESEMKPTAELTREEATALLMAYLTLPDTEKASTSAITDYAGISSRYRGYVLQAIEAGIINGFTDNSFRPKDTLTRAQAAKVLSVAAGTIADGDLSELVADKNLVVTAGGTIRDLTIKGNVFVSEGLTDTVTFSNCVIDGRIYDRSAATVVFSDCQVDELNVNAANAKVQLKQGTVVEELNANATAEIAFYTASEVETLTVAPAAVNTIISDLSVNGKIEKLIIQTTGVTSMIEPETCQIVSGATATVKDQLYGNGFRGEPACLWNSELEYLAFTTYADGTVKYYYTASATAPTATTFDTAYTGSAAHNVVSVKANVSNKIGVAGAQIPVEEAPYVVVMFTEGTTNSKPILVNRTAAKNGFTVAPTIKTTSTTDTLSFTPKYKGTLSYYYTNDNATPDSAAAILAFSNAATAVKGTINVTQTTAATQNTIKASVAEVYKFCVVYLTDATGFVFDPIVVGRPSATTGFTLDPEVQISTEAAGKDKLTLGVGSTGTIKWFYTNIDADFSIANFNSVYSATASALKGSSTVYSSTKSLTLTTTRELAETYTYVVVMLNADGSDHMPVKLMRTISSTGFKAAPALYYAPRANEQTTAVPMLAHIETQATGTVRVLYLANAVSYKAEDFLLYFNSPSVDDAYKTSFAVDSSLTYTDWLKDGDTTRPYACFLFTDNGGTNYKPVCVKRADIGNGFNGTPVVTTNVSSGTSSIKVNVKLPATLYYFAFDADSIHINHFNTLGTSYGMTSAEIPAASVGKDVTLNVGKLDLSKKFVAMALKVGDSLLQPVVVKHGEIDYGVSNVTISYLGGNDILHITPTASGTLRCYYTNVKPTNASEFEAGYAGATLRAVKSAIKGTDLDIIASDYRFASQYAYVALMLTGSGTTQYFPKVYEIPTVYHQGASFDLGGITLGVSSDKLTGYTVYWFHSKTEVKNLTTGEAFKTAYNSATSSAYINSAYTTLKGSKSVTGSSLVDVMNLLTSTSEYKYLYVAVKDNLNYYYIPWSYTYPAD